jgi:hypothetical protein
MDDSILEFGGEQSRIYNKPSGASSASAEQALSDFCWLAVRKDVDPQSLVTFKNLHNLNLNNLCFRMRKYPEEVRQAVTRIIHSKLGDRYARMDCAAVANGQPFDCVEPNLGRKEGKK